MEKSKRVVGYARVSTEAQDITRQIELITAYCSDRNYHLIKIIQEKISGARKDRKSLNELLDVDDAVGKSSVSCPLKPSDSAPLKHSTMPP